MRHKFITIEVHEQDEDGKEISYDKQTCEICFSSNTNDVCEKHVQLQQSNQQTLYHYIKEHKRLGIDLNRTI